MGGINFGWLAIWVLSSDWLSHKLEVCDIRQALRWSCHTWGRGVWAVPWLCIVHPGICFTNEEKSRKNLSQGNKNVFVWSAPNVICLVDLAKPLVSVSICRVAALGGSPRLLTLSQSSQTGPWYGRQTVEHPDPRVSACYLRTRGHQ
jgi:hypothetical protein